MDRTPEGLEHFTDRFNLISRHSRLANDETLAYLANYFEELRQTFANGPHMCSDVDFLHDIALTYSILVQRRSSETVFYAPPDKRERTDDDYEGFGCVLGVSPRTTRKLPSRKT